MSTVPGLFVIGEANFSDHGANRLGASALMQGLADGYFILPYTIGDYLARIGPDPVTTEPSEFDDTEREAAAKTQRLLDAKGSRSVDSFHRELGQIMWDYCGMSRTGEGLQTALEKIPELRERYWTDVRVTGRNEDFNQTLEKAGRVADFFEFAELMCVDALHREESCGGHFREEFQTEEGEALRNDDDFAYVAAWDFNGVGEQPMLLKENLEFEHVPLSQRSYK
ncbi:MAG: hypothetical protein V3T56_00050 [Gemmatimonadales bacterium]